MKIISWNINGLRAVERKGALQEFLNTHDPDVLFLQEIKGDKEQFSEYLNNPDEYQTAYHSAEKKGYSGTGVWVKESLLEQADDYSFFSGMPARDKGWTDYEGRVIGVNLTLQGTSFFLSGVYFPNGGKSEAAFEEKLVFYQDFLQFVNKQRKEGKVCIWGGDVNCAHNEIDLARPKENDGVVGFHPRERAWMDQVNQEGWLDIWRHTYPDRAEVYSWWHYYTQSRARNVGWRIDYLFCDEANQKMVSKIEYLNEQMGSDHCPVSVEVKVP